jgi:hypothetical protein
MARRSLHAGRTLQEGKGEGRFEVERSIAYRQTLGSIDLSNRPCASHALLGNFKAGCQGSIRRHAYIKVDIADLDGYPGRVN